MMRLLRFLLSLYLLFCLLIMLMDGIGRLRQADVLVYLALDRATQIRLIDSATGVNWGITDYRTIYGFTVSPDNRMISYDERLGSNESVIQVQALLSPRHRATDLDKSISPAWSPDGQWIAYLKRNYDNLVLRIMRPNGSEKTTLLETHSSPAWSSDSQALLYTQSTATGYALQRYELATGESTWLIDLDFLPSLMDWQGDTIALVNERQAYLLHIPTQTFSSLYDEGISEAQPRWSADGSKIAFISSENPRNLRAAVIVILDTETGQIRRLPAPQLVVGGLVDWWNRP